MQKIKGKRRQIDKTFTGSHLIKTLTLKAQVLSQLCLPDFLKPFSWKTLMAVVLFCCCLFCRPITLLSELFAKDRKYDDLLPKSGKVGNYTIFHLPTFCETFLPKVIKIQLCILQLQLKMSGILFMTHIVYSVTNFHPVIPVPILLVII